MPRKHRAARAAEPAPPLREPASAPPGWALVPGLDVRAFAGGSKTYRCPGCDQEIRPSVGHLVVMPQGFLDERRHWHTGCWQRELRRTRRPLPGGGA